MSAGLSALELEVIAACLSWVVRSGTKNIPFVPTGKSLPIFRNNVKPRKQKYFAFPEGQIKALVGSSLPTRGGRFAIVTMRWARDAVDAFVQARFWRADE
jgi:hypothetical protein